MDPLSILIWLAIAVVGIWLFLILLPFIVTLVALAFAGILYVIGWVINLFGGRKRRW